jgi:hypothetical protein
MPGLTHGGKSLFGGKGAVKVTSGGGVVEIKELRIYVEGCEKPSSWPRHPLRSNRLSPRHQAYGVMVLPTLFTAHHTVYRCSPRHALAFRGSPHNLLHLTELHNIT